MKQPQLIIILIVLAISAPAQLTRDENFDKGTLKLDITDDDSIRKGVELVLSKYGRIDGLVNNAGLATPNKVENLVEEEVVLQVQTNFVGTVLCCQAAIPLLPAVMATLSPDGTYFSGLMDANVDLTAARISLIELVLNFCLTPTIFGKFIRRSLL